MKGKHIAILLGILLGVSALALLTAGCKTEKKQFQAGFGKVEISPDEGVELGSYGNESERQCRGVWTSLYALALALTDENDETLIIVITDLSWGNVSMNRQVRAKVKAAYGIPEDHVLVGGTHNHNAPSPASNNPKNVEYMQQWYDGVMKAIDKAMKDRKPASIEVGRTETENLVFSRRYVREDGNYVGGGPNTYNVQSNSPIVAHESEADEEIQMVRFVREDAKDILIAQWQSHACNINADRDKDFHYMASAEWPGVMREAVEEALDVHCMYMQGAAGNMGCHSRIEGEMAVEDEEDFFAIGELLADYVIKANEANGTFKKVNRGAIKTKQYQMSVTTREGVNVEGDQRPEMNTVAIGDLSLVTLPVELFDTSGKWLKDNTPYAMTLIMDYACGNGGYQAPDWAYPHQCYEVLNGIYVEGTAEKMMQYHLDTLKEFYEAK